ncbi:uncharacterized protein LOC122310182 [Carya illinoinensis]|uniref:uncharacterized protein LOC122310182 n=1 Tax=Carya illinoinensis TaxID=32201 RepID=UPI001C719945|nr:uncharacterized protein LOC122310182 [Carya illinoinensis]
MDKAWMSIEDRFMSNEYAMGVSHFMNMAKEHAQGGIDIRCPCRRCRNMLFQPITTVEEHLFIIGIDPSYKDWIFHGEEEVLDVNSSEEGDDASGNDAYIDDMDELLDDIQAGASMDQSGGSHIPGIDGVTPGGSSATFSELLEDARSPLYPSCSTFSKLSFIVKLLHIKTVGGWSVKSFNMVIKLLKSAFPNALLPDSYNDACRLERGLGFNYTKIDACLNDCVLFWKEHSDKEKCPKCNTPRWVLSSTKQKKIPHKVLRHFPLVPRLQRLFVSNKTAGAMRWHSTERVNDYNVMRHPADSKVWKDFDVQYPQFASDPRNVRIGLASDGFNPFNNIAKPYSIWPVILVAYNLPPWLCMKDPYLMLSLLIPGPKAPGNDIDVYLRPLIEELKFLWEVGVNTYDAFADQSFRLHAALLWTINDFPAYANLSGWSTKGKLACPTCNGSTNSLWLVHGRKHYYMGHRRWLLPGHRWRSKKAEFNGSTDHHPAPIHLSGEAILEQLRELQDVQFGKLSKKRKRTANELNWTKKSVFFDLPYWKSLELRHNLDVMHIEKNICDSVLGTLMDIEGKSKDTANAHRDLANLGIRKELHLQPEGDSCSMRLACYMLNKKEKRSFCEWLASVKFPDGFAVNIARCVNVRESKILGMKSHDSHIFMQRLLPVVISGYLTSDVRQALTELSSFFKKLCARALNIDVLHRLQTDISLILCKLEMIFPPAFFDIMVHLAIHLPQEALLAGPVQYRWMYPFERYLGKFKRYVKNMTRPEGSIAEAYIHVECLTFCSMYLHDIETTFTREERNVDVGLDHTPGSMSVFFQKVRPMGSSSTDRLNDQLFAKAECQHYNKIKEEDPSNVDRRHQTEFGKWFKNHIRELRILNPYEVTDELYALACGPDPWVGSYSGCIINGIRFHTKDREQHRRSQNSGVVVARVHQSMPVDFYGVLKEILELRYMGWHLVYLFKCDWWDVGDHRRGIRVGDHLTSVNTSRKWYQDEPFTLASQCSQVFYLKDDSMVGNWQVVQKITNRNVYDIPPIQTALDDGEDSSEGDAFQEEEASTEDFPINESDTGLGNTLHRENEEVIVVNEATTLPRSTPDNADQTFIEDDVDGDDYGDHPNTDHYESENEDDSQSNSETDSE